MKSLEDPQCKAEIIERIGRVQQDSPRRWGKMTAPQMVCHLNDCFIAIIGGKPISRAPGHYPRILFKWIALYAPVQWPHDVATRPEFDQCIGGTAPAVFEEDKRRLLALVEEFGAKANGVRSKTHPVFGGMSLRDWMRWGYLHTDHHLRQFGQ